MATVPVTPASDSRPRILVLYPGGGFMRPLAQRFPQADFAFHEDAEAGLADAAGCAAVISMSLLMTRDVATRLFREPSLRWIQIGSAGADRLEGVVPPPGVQLTRAGGVLDAFVAEQALALLLALGRRIPDALRNQAEGRWGLPKQGFESVAGRRVTVLGFGDIGRAIAARLVAMEAIVTGVSRNPKPMAGVALRPVAELGAVLDGTEVLMLVLPGGAATAGMIGAAEIARLTPGAMIINVGRGSSLDHVALAEALRSGRLAGAGLDVTDPEPLPPGHPLWSCPNLIVTPHVGGRDRRQPERLYRLVEANITRFLAGEDLLYRFA
jgi:phosphoglycerate dehydrogenase-like enzyme